MSLETEKQLLELVVSLRWRATPDGKAFETSKWDEFTGRDVGTAIGSNWLEDVHPDDRERTAKIWQASRDAKAPYKTQYRIRRHDGVYRWFDAAAVPVFDDAGNISEYSGICIEAHDRILALEQTSSVLENIAAAFVTIDKDWVITYQNREGARLNKKPAHEIIGKKMYEEWPEILNSPLEWNYRKAMAEQREVRFEHRYYDPGLYDLWLDITAVPTMDGGLGILYLDQTDRRTAEQAVIRSENRFRQLVDNLEAAFLLTDTEGARVYYASPFAESVFGVCNTDLKHKLYLLIDAIHPEDRERVLEAIWGTGDSEQEEYRLLHQDGNVRWVTHRVSRIAETEEDDPDDSEQVDRYRLAHIITDNTEQHSLQEQLQVAQRMESLGRLAGGVAHDFNNVLSIIMGRASLMQAQLAAGDVGKLAAGLNEILEATNSGSRITQQILTFAKRQEGAVQVVDLNEMVTNSAGLIQRLLGDGIELSPILRDQLPPVRFDPAQFDQLVFNLTANAAAAMDDTGCLTIETREVALDQAEAKEKGLNAGDYVLLSVKDTGSGIPANLLGQIFDPFFTTKGSDGTGLGLATCYGMMAAAGGSISVSSTPGAGSCFDVWFPAASGETPTANKIKRQPRIRGDETLLLVEDDSQLRRLLQEGLADLGYHVTAPHSPGEALQWLRDNPCPDLLITDMIMPEMTGSALAEAALEIFPDLPVLTISGFKGEAHLPEGIVPDDLGFLPKPFTPADLAERIRIILSYLGNQASAAQV